MHLPTVMVVVRRVVFDEFRVGSCAGVPGGGVRVVDQRVEPGHRHFRHRCDRSRVRYEVDKVVGRGERIKRGADCSLPELRGRGDEVSHVQCGGGFVWQLLDPRGESEVVSGHGCCAPATDLKGLTTASLRSFRFCQPATAGWHCLSRLDAVTPRNVPGGLSSTGGERGVPVRGGRGRCRVTGLRAANAAACGEMREALA